MELVNSEVVRHERFDRVRRMTPKELNKHIDEKMMNKVRQTTSLGAEAIKVRLEELEREWDIDRVVMTVVPACIFAELMLARKNKAWLILPMVQAPFLVMHATLGWFPPDLVLRTLGVRTRKEIQTEREFLIKLLENY